jgi:polyisoprenoid-binding protein YceI
MRQIRFFILPLVASGLVHAQTGVASKPARIQEYRLDAGHSIIEFSIGFAFSRIKGRFTSSNGTIVYDTVDPARSSITVVIDSKSIDTGWPHRDEHLRTADFFDVEKYPTIVFQSERLTRTDKGWRADGKLTMHGVTRAISIPFRLLQPPTRSPESNWMLINAQGSLKIARADFGILGGSAYNSWFDKARQATMSDSVEVNLEIEGWNADAQSQRTARLEQSLERIRTTGVQAQIDRLAEIMRTQPSAAAGVMNGADFVTRALLGTGKIDDAVKLSKALTDLLPAQPRAFVLYGVALAMSGDNKGALRQYAKAKEIFKPAARDPIEKFPQVDETWYYLDQLTEFLLEWNRPAVALPVARTISELYPDFARAHTTLGVVLAATGDSRGATAAYSRALALDPQETRALEFRRRL